MITSEPKREERILLSDISWQAFQAMADAIGERHVRLTYDEGDLEIMTISFGHENAGEWIGQLIFFLALEWKIPLCSGGSTTLKQELRKKGLEPDKCFWIGNEKAMRGKKEWKSETDPPPDLVVEVDITSSSLNRLGIYGVLGVPEIWHFDGEHFKVLVLGGSGKYQEKNKSPTFPGLPIKDFVPFVKMLGTAGEIELIQSFRDWLQGISNRPD